MSTIKPSVDTDRRHQHRESIEDFERYKGSIGAAYGSDFLIPFIPFDINAFGIGVSIQKSQIPYDWKVGSTTGPIRLTLVDLVIADIPAATICSMKPNSKNSTQVDFGLRFLYDRLNAPLADKRPERRLRFQDVQRPRAQASHPLKLGENLHFEIEDLSASGARVSCSVRNRLLWKGLQFEDFTIFLAGQNPVQIPATITYVSKPIQGKLFHLGLQFTSITNKARTSLIQGSLLYAELDQNAPLQDLREAGFKPKFIRDQLNFSYVHNAHEYQQVLTLRQKAYSRAGKLDASTSPDQMADEFDLNSKIIIASFRGEIIGSMRITRCTGENDRFELDASIQLPKRLPRTQTIEISRLCVDERFENTDLVLGLIERATILSVQLGVQKIITSCVAEMLPYYAKMGFYPTGLKFELSTLNGIPHFFLMHDSRTHMQSFRLNPLYWQYTFKRSLQHLYRLRYIREPKLSLWKRMQAAATILALKLTGKKPS